MSTEAFENFYFDVCIMDYKKMSVAMDPLKALMERTDKVQLKGKGTDLTQLRPGPAHARGAPDIHR